MLQATLERTAATCTAASRRRWPTRWTSRARSSWRSTWATTGASPRRRRRSTRSKSPVLLACLQESAQLWTLTGHRRRQHRDRAADVRGADGAVLAQGRRRARARTAGAAKAQAQGDAGPAVPPFSVKLLVDEATMRARQASLSLLTVSPANRIAMHKHPGAEMLYVLKGHARVLGPQGTHAREDRRGDGDLHPRRDARTPSRTWAAQSPAAMLEIFAPLGPERVYRDPKDAGRARRVRGDPRSAPGGRRPAGAHFVVASVRRQGRRPIAWRAARRACACCSRRRPPAARAPTSALLEADAGRRDPAPQPRGLGRDPVRRVGQAAS